MASLQDLMPLFERAGKASDDGKAMGVDTRWGVRPLFVERWKHTTRGIC